MRCFLSVLVVAGALLAQQQQPNPEVMQKAEEAARAAAMQSVQQNKQAAPAPAPAAPATNILGMPPATVIATVDGEKVTAGTLQTIIRSLPPQVQQQALANRLQFLQQYGMMRRLAADALKDKLDQQSPYKEQIEHQRLTVLTQAAINNRMNSTQIPAEELKANYEKEQDKYAQARLKAIYIPFVTASAATAPAANQPKPLTEEEARAKADEVVKQARGGTDFVALVKQNSKDPTSAGKDGDFGTIARNAPVPDNVKAAVFAAKPGEVTDPVRQPNGFYIFRVEEVSTQPYEQVENSIREELKNARFAAWMTELQKSIDVKMEGETSPAQSAAQPAAPATAAAKPAAK